MESIHKERLISLFKRLVETDSPTFNERAVCDIVKKELERMGIKACEDDTGNRIGGTAGNLYAFINGNIDLPPILFYAHMDTVEPSHGKRLIAEKNGTLHSDGTTVLGSDDLAGVSSILEAIHQ